MKNSFTEQGFTAIETVLAVAILSIVGLTIGEVFTRTNRMAENSRQAERAAALGEMVLEQYNAYAARSYDRLPSFDRTRAEPRDFFAAADDFGYGGLTITTRAEPSPEDSLTRVSVRIGWGGGLFPPSLAFFKVYPQRMSGDYSDGENVGL